MENVGVDQGIPKEVSEREWSYPGILDLVDDSAYEELYLQVLQEAMASSFA